MTFLPIVDRELRLAARQQGVFWWRVAAAAVALFIGSGYFALLSATPFPGGFSLGGTLLAILSWLSLVVALSAGLFLTSDCLSEEKREGTLGLLFLTDLRGYDVVLGKLVATSLRSAFTFLALFPILATTFLLGGVESGQFWKTMLALLNALFFSLATGMLVSAISRNGQKSLAGTLVLLALWTLGGVAVDTLAGAIQERPARAVFRLASPLHVFQSANGWPRFFWQGFFVSQLVAWLQLALACVLIQKTWQDQKRKSETGMAKWLSWWRRGGEKGRRALREKWLERDPILWLALRERGWLSFVWFWPALLIAGVIAAILQMSGGRMLALWSFLSGPLLSLVVYLAVASQASQFFVEARRTRLLELLLAAPLDPKAIVMGPWRALVRLSSGLVVLMIVVHLMGTGFTFSMRTSVGFEFFAMLGITVLLGVVVTVANLAALGWFGMWMGITSRNTLLATLKTIVFVSIVPWFVMMVAGGLLVRLVLLPTLMKSAASTSTAWFSTWYPLLSTALTASLALGKDFLFWRWSRRKLMRDFREQATRVVAPIMIHPISGAVPPPPPILRT